MERFMRGRASATGAAFNYDEDVEAAVE